MQIEQDEDPVVLLIESESSSNSEEETLPLERTYSDQSLVADYPNAIQHKRDFKTNSHSDVISRRVKRDTFDTDDDKEPKKSTVSGLKAFFSERGESINRKLSKRKTAGPEEMGKLCPKSPSFLSQQISRKSGQHKKRSN